MKSIRAVLILTFLLIVFYVSLQYNISAVFLATLFFLFPISTVVTVFIILKDNRQPYPELGENEEWGYRDKSRDEFGSGS